VAPVHRDIADHSGQPPVADDRRLEAIVARNLLAGPGDEGPRVLKLLGSRPGQPAGELLAVGFDQGVKLGRVVLIEQAEPGGFADRQRTPGGDYAALLGLHQLFGPICCFNQGAAIGQTAP
jgi:hypothetical protein